MANEPLSHPGDPDGIFDISFDLISIEHLKQISIWAKVTSICAFIGYIFSLIAVFFGHPTVRGLADESQNSAAIMSIAKASSIIMTILVVIIGGAINYFLYRFAVAVGHGVRRIDALQVNGGFDNLRIYFKTVGILLIIVLAILVLALLGSLAAGTLIANSR